MNKILTEDYDLYMNRKDLVDDLDRIILLRDCIKELKGQIETLDINYAVLIKKMQNETLKLEKSSLCQEKMNQLINEIKDEITNQKNILQYKKNLLEKELRQFKDIYNSLCHKGINVRCKDLVDELKKISGKEIYTNLSMNMVSSKHSSVNKIMKEYKDKLTILNMTISDKENPEYIMEINDVLYSKGFSVNFSDKQYDNRPLSEHFVPSYKFSDDGKRYTSIRFNDEDDIKLKFLLIDLIEEDNEYCKPVSLLREAICNCKDKEYKRKVEFQKTKRI